MHLLKSFVTFLILIIHGASAIPLHPHHKHAKRTTTSLNVGSGFAIAVCTIILAAIFYYLGMHHERTRSWLLQRNPHTTPQSFDDNEAIPQPHRLKTRISCPLAVHSSAPIRPYDNLVEAPIASVQCFELPIKEIHEMGLPSPKKPPPRASWLSLDRKPWWLGYSANEEQGRSAGADGRKSMRSWFKSDRSMSDVQGVPKSSSVSAEAISSDAQCVKEEEKERKSDGSTLMDWTGLEHVRKIYIARKSKTGV